MTPYTNKQEHNGGTVLDNCDRQSVLKRGKAGGTQQILVPNTLKSSHGQLPDQGVVPLSGRTLQGSSPPCGFTVPSSELPSLFIQMSPAFAAEQSFSQPASSRNPGVPKPLCFRLFLYLFSQCWQCLLLKTILSFQ